LYDGYLKIQEVSHYNSTLGWRIVALFRLYLTRHLPDISIITVPMGLFKVDAIEEIIVENLT